jgi:hypothetical protein
MQLLGIDNIIRTLARYIKNYYMQIIIQLDAETARQLDEIQKHTNQEYTLVIQQGIGLYYQQLQPHRQFYMETKKHYELVGSAPANTSAN